MNQHHVPPFLRNDGAAAAAPTLQGVVTVGGVISGAAAPQKALTYDDGKAPLATLPWAGIDSMANVQAYGHKKYGDFYNYRKGMEISRNLSCAIRHIRDFMDGQDLDAESGESHLGHAMTRLAFVLQNIKDGTVIDDRFSRRAPQGALNTTNSQGNT